MSARKLLLLTTLVVLLFAFILLIERRLPSTAERQQKADLHWELPEDRIEGIRLSRTGSVVELAKGKDGVWRLVKPEPYPADGGAVSDVISQLARLRRAAETSSEGRPEDYGLKAPQARATIFWRTDAKARKPQSRTLEFGIEIPGTDATGARLEGTETVLFVPTSVANAVKKGADDFRSKEVFAGSASEAVRLEVERGRGRLSLAKKNGIWWLQQPLTDLADGDAVEKLTGTLTALRALDFLPQGERGNLAALGLSPPLFRVTLFTGKGTDPPVELGATRSNGNSVYARREGQVFTVASAIVEDLSREAEVLRDPHLVRFDRASAGRIEATFARSQFTIERKEGGWTAQGHPVTAPAADDLLTAALDLKSKSFLDDQQAAALSSREPGATVSIHLAKPDQWTLKLFRKGPDTEALVSGRPGAFLVSGDAAAVLEAAVRKAAVPPPVTATARPAAPTAVSRKP